MKNIKLENISKLAEDIVLTEQNEKNLFNAYKKKIEYKKRKDFILSRIVVIMVLH